MKEVVIVFSQSYVMVTNKLERKPLLKSYVLYYQPKQMKKYSNNTGCYIMDLTVNTKRWKMK